MHLILIKIFCNYVMKTNMNVKYKHRKCSNCIPKGMLVHITLRKQCLTTSSIWIECTVISYAMIRKWLIQKGQILVIHRRAHSPLTSYEFILYMNITWFGVNISIRFKYNAIPDNKDWQWKCNGIAIMACCKEFHVSLPFSANMNPMFFSLVWIISGFLMVYWHISTNVGYPLLH